MQQYGCCCRGCDWRRGIVCQDLLTVGAIILLVLGVSSVFWSPHPQCVTVDVAGPNGRRAALKSLHRARAGHITYSQETADGGENVSVCQLDGSNVEVLTHDRFRNTQPALSPDGASLAFASNRSGQTQVYIFNLTNHRVRQLTNHALGAQYPAFSPDGTMLACVITDGGYSQIAVIPMAGGQLRNISRTQSHETAPCWSPDGSQLCWVTDRFGGLELVVGDKNGGTPRRLTSTGGWNCSPAWCPDSRTIAFLSNRRGSPQIYLTDLQGQVVTCLKCQPTPGMAPTATPDRMRLTMSCVPSWSPDGSELLYSSELNGASTFYIINRDGTGRRKLFTALSALARTPSWVR